MANHASRQASAGERREPDQHEPGGADEAGSEAVAEPAGGDLHGGVGEHERGREEADDRQADAVRGRGAAGDRADVREVPACGCGEGEPAHGRPRAMPSTHAASLDEACRIRLGDLFSEVDHGERSVARDRAAPPGGARGGRPRGVLPACRDEPRLRPVGDQPADRGARARGRPAARRALARRRSRRADRGGRARPAALRRDPRPSEGGPGRRRGARRRAVGRVARRHHAVGRRSHPPGPDAAVCGRLAGRHAASRRGGRRPPAL